MNLFVFLYIDCILIVVLIVIVCNFGITVYYVVFCVLLVTKEDWLPVQAFYILNKGRCQGSPNLAPLYSDSVAVVCQSRY